MLFLIIRNLNLFTHALIAIVDDGALFVCEHCRRYGLVVLEGAPIFGVSPDGVTEYTRSTARRWCSRGVHSRSSVPGPALSYKTGAAL